MGRREKDLGLVVEGERKVQTCILSGKIILTYNTGVPGAAAGVAQALPCNLEAGLELSSRNAWESMDKHGQLLEQGEIADGCVRTYKGNPAWGWLGALLWRGEQGCVDQAVVGERTPTVLMLCVLLEAVFRGLVSMDNWD